MTTSRGPSYEEASQSPGAEDGGAQTGVAAASHGSHSTQKRVMMGLCQPKETGLQLRVWVSLAPTLPPERTLASLPNLVLRMSCADEEGPVP